MTTLAGNGYQGSANGGSSLSRLNLPRGVSISPDGTTIAIADYGNHIIRKLAMPNQGWSTANGTAPNVLMSTLAGKGLGGMEDGVGTLAGFKNPSGVAISPDGTWVAVADTNNGMIRKVMLADGKTTTLAGSGVQGYQDGVGTVAAFSLPVSVDFNEKGDGLAVADTGNHRIRWLNLSTGVAVVSTLSGSKIKTAACGFGTYKNSGSCPKGRCLCGAEGTPTVIDAECGVCHPLPPLPHLPCTAPDTAPSLPSRALEEVRGYLSLAQLPFGPSHTLPSCPPQPA